MRNSKIPKANVEYIDRESINKTRERMGFDPVPIVCPGDLRKYELGSGATYTGFNTDQEPSAPVDKTLGDLEAEANTELDAYGGHAPGDRYIDIEVINKARERMGFEPLELPPARAIRKEKIGVYEELLTVVYERMDDTFTLDYIEGVATHIRALAKLLGEEPRL